jgi:spermidine/putrescine transport system ATP-binding protein
VAETRHGGRIELGGLSKWYGDNQVLRDLDLVIEAGEFFSLLGPSGCGKTTTLRLIGGFEEITHGSVRIDGEEMRGVRPEKRPVNTVFQSYALFPHKSVADNVAFGLRFLDCTKAETRRRVGEALELVQLQGFESRRPHQLSGGQQQRVALARSLVLRPSVLLLDEPLGALDAQLRRALQGELRALHREVGITFVYVTHDQEEALTMSDRLAVMNKGRLEQVGTPREVYESPSTGYVADFLGIANLLPAEVTASGATVHGLAVASRAEGIVGACTAVVRPERVRVEPAGGHGLPGVVDASVFAGALTHVVLSVGGRRVEALIANDGSRPSPAEGDQVTVSFDAEGVRFLANEAPVTPVAQDEAIAPR